MRRVTYLVLRLHNSEKTIWFASKNLKELLPNGTLVDIKFAPKFLEFLVGKLHPKIFFVRFDWFVAILRRSQLSRRGSIKWSEVEWCDVDTMLTMFQIFSFAESTCGKGQWLWASQCDQMLKLKVAQFLQKLSKKGY